jgi:hypothetical protein
MDRRSEWDWMLFDTHQLSLFQDLSNKAETRDWTGLFKEGELSALDELFAASRRYRDSIEYMEILNFIARFPKYSPFNCLLLHIQNPSISYVATAGTWAKKFGRYPRHDARPLVILAPMSPVLFVFDLKDTDGQPVSKELLRPFEKKGRLATALYRDTVHNCGLHGIGIRETLLRNQRAGGAVRLNHVLRKQYRTLTLEPWLRYLILVNKEHLLEEKYSSLVYELAHIFGGHLGIDDEAWWLDRRDLEEDAVEVEAESTAYLVCRRKGLHSSSEKYLPAYKTDRVKQMPVFSLSAIIQATTYIEEMGQTQWKRPKKKSRYKPRKNR